MCTWRTRLERDVFWANCFKSLASGFWLMAKYCFMVRNWWCLKEVRILFVLPDADPGHELAPFELPSSKLLWSTIGGKRKNKRSVSLILCVRLVSSSSLWTPGNVYMKDCRGWTVGDFIFYTLALNLLLPTSQTSTKSGQRIQIWKRKETFTKSESRYIYMCSSTSDIWNDESMNKLWPWMVLPLLTLVTEFNPHSFLSVPSFLPAPGCKMVAVISDYFIYLHTFICIHLAVNLIEQQKHSLFTHA